MAPHDRRPSRRCSPPRRLPPPRTRASRTARSSSLPVRAAARRTSTARAIAPASSSIRWLRRRVRPRPPSLPPRRTAGVTTARSVSRRASARSSRWRFSASRACSRPRARTRPTGCSSEGVLADGYVELESAAFRDKIEAQGRRAQADATEAERVEKGARKRAIEMYNAPCRRLSERGAARRGPLLPRVRIRAGGRREECARRLLRADPEGPHLEAHTECLSRVRRAVLQRGAGGSGEMGSRGASLLGGHQVSAARQQGVWLCLVQDGLRLLEQGRARQIAQCVQEDRRLRRGVPHRARRREARRQRATRRHPGLCAEGRSRPAPTTSCHNLSGDPTGTNDKDAPHARRSRDQLHRHRPLPRGHRGLQDLLARTRARASAGTRRTSPTRRWP